MVGLVLIGAFLRTRGLFVSPLAFWQDEAGWAIITLKQPLIDQLIRPIGFLALSKVFARLFGPTELAFRLIPWLASLIGLVLGVRIARVLLPSAAGRLLFVAVLAFHPDAIDMAKEFKPYSVSLTFHLALILCAISYLRSRSDAWLWSTIVTSIVALFFAQDIVFAYLGVYLAVGIATLRARKLRHTLFVTLSAAFTLALLSGLYWFMWQHMSDSDPEQGTMYWGRKYNVFYVPLETAGTRFQWLLGKYLELAQFPGGRHNYWSSHGHLSAGALAGVQTLDKVVWTLLHVLGIGALFLRRRWLEALVLVLPFAVLILFNQLGFWPFGSFRTNLFALSYSALIAAFVFRAPGSRSFAFSMTPACILVFLPLIAFERTWHKQKISDFTYQSHFRETLDELAKLSLPQRGRSRKLEPLLFDHMGCSCWSYYSRVHPRYRKLAMEMRRRFQTRCVWRKEGSLPLARTLLADFRRVWILAADERGVSEVVDTLPQGYRIAVQKILAPNAAIFALERSPGERRP